MAASCPWRHNEQVLQGVVKNPMTREVMEPSNAWGPATQLLGEAIQIADGGTLPRVLLMLCLVSVYIIIYCTVLNK